MWQIKILIFFLRPKPQALDYQFIAFFFFFEREREILASTYGHH